MIAFYSIIFTKAKGAMLMKQQGILLAVRNIEKSKAFYTEVLDLKVKEDLGVHVVLSDGIFLQTIDTWKDFIGCREEEILLKNRSTEVYFEEDDMDTFLNKLEARKDISYVHPPMTHSWGQRVVRIYDPDGHIIEIGENIVMVVKRFIAEGLSIAETAARMDVSEDYIQHCLSE